MGDSLCRRRCQYEVVHNSVCYLLDTKSLTNRLIMARENVAPDA